MEQTKKDLKNISEAFQRLSILKDALELIINETRKENEELIKENKKLKKIVDEIRKDWKPRLKALLTNFDVVCQDIFRLRIHPDTLWQLEMAVPNRLKKLEKELEEIGKGINNGSG